MLSADTASDTVSLSMPAAAGDAVGIPAAMLGIFSCSSTMMRCAVFRPIPLTLFRVLSSPEDITSHNSPMVNADKIVRAVFPPIPETEISSLFHKWLKSENLLSKQ